MELTALQAIGTVVSVLAVVLSVAGLAVGIRHHTQALRAQNYAHALDRLASIQARLSTGEAMASVFARGVRDVRRLTLEERIQFTWVLYEIFGAFEFMFDQAKAGTLPRNVWERWAATVSWWLSLPGVQAWWLSKPTPFAVGFTGFVENRLHHPVGDAAAAARWQEFLRHGGPNLAGEGATNCDAQPSTYAGRTRYVGGDVTVRTPPVEQGDPARSDGAD